ncbi:unnamed protein product [Choristocarpus tenellus]
MWSISSMCKEKSQGENAQDEIEERFSPPCKLCWGGVVSNPHHCTLIANCQFQDRGIMELYLEPSSSPKASLSTPGFTSIETSEFKDLIAVNGLYRIKFSSSDGNPTDDVVTSVPACDLRLAGFREEMVLHVDNDGAIIGVDYKAPIGPLASTKDCKKLAMPDAAQVLSTVKVVHAADAQSIPVQVYAPYPPPGLGHLKENAEQKKGAGNQSLVVKYWYIFLPLALSWMFSAGSAPEQSGGGSGSGGGGGGGSR